MKLFSLDSPLLQGLTKMADLLILNLLAFVCCIPIVTAGASFTALHYMALKMARNEETYIVRGFFKSFKQNFKQATIIWLIILVLIVFLVGDFLLFAVMESAPDILVGIVMGGALFVLFGTTFVFPLLAKFDNTIRNTIKNAFIVSMMHFPKTILMLILNWLPWVLIYVLTPMAPLCIMFGFSLPAYISAFLYNKFFKKLEDQIRANNAPDEPVVEENAEDDRIFHDELDETIAARENIH